MIAIASQENRVSPDSICRDECLPIQIGPFSVSLNSDIPQIRDGVSRFYQYFERADYDFLDFHVSLDRPKGLRRWFRPQVDFLFDGVKPFKPLPLDQGLALFEWGLNWCMTNHCQEYLVIHAAVVEKNGLALILPAPPGAGKSTFCAALVCSGWRLLSDELTLLKPNSSGQIIPLARPVCLKNESISVIKAFSPDSEFGPLCRGTTKGDVAHLLAPRSSVEAIEKMAKARWIVFPRYIRGSATLLNKRSKASTFFELARQSFNFHILGEEAFTELESMVGECDCFDFTYSDLEQGISAMNNLADTSV